MNATKRKTPLPARLAAVRLWLLLVVAFCGLETRVWSFAATPSTASGEIALATPSFIGENYDSVPYDASDSLVAAKTATSLPADIAASFRGGNYSSHVLQSDVVAYRFSGGVSEPTGRFLTTQQTVRWIGTPDEAIRALNLPPGATAQQLNAFTIPKGTQIFYGRVEGGAQGATQIFIRDRGVLVPAP
jgi:hypothetical protein